MKRRMILTALIGLSLLSACSSPQATLAVFFTPTALVLPSPTLSLSSPMPTAILPSTAGVLPTLAPTGNMFVTVPAPTATSRPAVTPAAGATQPNPATFCADPQPPALISSLKAALQNSDGELLAPLVSPANGMDVRYYRNGRVVNYDQTHAKFLFESDFQVNWGDAPGNGLPTVGSFHEVIIPAMKKVFDTNYTLSCDQLQVGGTTYTAQWPYPGVNYYSLYFPGTEANGNMDWHTWVVGMEYINGRPYIHSMMQFEWEI